MKLVLQSCFLRLLPTAKVDEEDEYVPPKPEGSTITEDDATYTKK